MPPDMAETNSKPDLVLSNSKSPSDSGNVYRSPHHSSNMLQNLNSLRLNNKFCDVEIAAGRSIVKVCIKVLFKMHLCLSCSLKCFITYISYYLIFC